MVIEQVVPELRLRAGEPPAVRTEQLRVAGLGESQVARLLLPLEAGPALGGPAVLPRLPRRGAGAVHRRRRLARWSRRANGRRRCWAMPSAATDDETLPMTVLRLLGGRAQTVAVAESLTGGLLASALVDVPGGVGRGGGRACSRTRPSSRPTLLDVPADLLERVGPVHPEVAAAMATGVATRLGADWGVGRPRGRRARPSGRRRAGDRPRGRQRPGATRTRVVRACACTATARRCARHWPAALRPAPPRRSGAAAEPGTSR